MSERNTCDLYYRSLSNFWGSSIILPFVQRKWELEVHFPVLSFILWCYNPLFPLCVCVCVCVCVHLFMMGLSLLPRQERFRKRISVETPTSDAEDGRRWWWGRDVSKIGQHLPKPKPSCHVTLSVCDCPWVGAKYVAVTDQKSMIIVLDRKVELALFGQFAKFESWLVDCGLGRSATWLPYLRFQFQFPALSMWKDL